MGNRTPHVVGGGLGSIRKNAQAQAEAERKRAQAEAMREAMRKVARA